MNVLESVLMGSEHELSGKFNPDSLKSRYKFKKNWRLVYEKKKVYRGDFEHQRKYYKIYSEQTFFLQMSILPCLF